MSDGFQIFFPVIKLRHVNQVLKKNTKFLKKKIKFYSQDITTIKIIKNLEEILLVFF